MVNIHIALVGRDTGNVINGMQIQGGTELYPVTSPLFHKKSIPEIIIALPAVKVHSEINGRSLVEDPFKEDSFVKIVGLIIKIVQARQNEEGVNILINITGGTNLMAGAAVTAAMLTGAGAYYVNKHPDKEQYDSSIVDLPLIMDSVKVLKNDGRKRILKLLEDEEEWKNETIEAELKINRKSISKQIKILEAKGLVASRKDGKNRINQITDEGRIAVKVMQ